ncbi:hypothetical protein LCGC14_0420470 [marine sediment metagenome]|uniref:Uncharacterized protein n=1 Tax=marine sediment metagenome TaxID=412755 RepID=A0A0F9W085_9ZZZZ
MTKQEEIKHIVLLDIKSDGSIPDYQDIGWLRCIEDGFVTIHSRTGTISRYKTETVKKLRFLEVVNGN